MKKLKKITAILMILIMGISTVFCGNAIKALAASTQFTISVSSSEIKKGGTLTVTVSLSCSEAIGAYSYCLTYDSSVLEYSSGDGYGSGGTITCAGYGDGSSTSASNSFSFSAVGTGSSYIGTSGADVYTWGEENCSVSNAGATISVTAKKDTESTTETSTSSSDDATTESETTGEGDETTEEAEETTEEISDNCLLASLEITPGELNPEFSSEVYSYETTVSSEVTSLAINAIADDAKSSVTINGNGNFEPGATSQITITVTAETGDTHIYDILVTVDEAVDTRYVLNVNGTDYYFTQDYSKLSVPEGFAQITETVDECEIILYSSPNGLIECAYLTDEEGTTGAWYIVDLDAGTITPLISVLSSYTTFIILEPDNSVVKPEGYTAFTYEFSGNGVTAYRYSETDDIILVYAMTGDTDPCWYRYDTQIQTFVRYIADTAPATDEEASFFEENKIAIITTCLIIFLIMLILIIVLIRLLSRANGKNSPDDDTNFSYPQDEETENFVDTPSPVKPVKASKPTESVDFVEDSAFVNTPSPDEDSAFVNAPSPDEDSVFANVPSPDEDSAFTNIAAPDNDTVFDNSQASGEDSVPADMTELKAPVNEAPKDIQMKSKNNVSGETNDIIKKAAQYSSLNTADLSEVFDMAESIVHDGEDTSNEKAAKNNSSENVSLQFKPIKQNLKKEDTEN